MRIVDTRSYAPLVEKLNYLDALASQLLAQEYAQAIVAAREFSRGAREQSELGYLGQARPEFAVVLLANGQERIRFLQLLDSDGRVHLVPARLVPADEKPDADYPMVLITGRVLEHWHTGSMTRRSQVLDAIEPLPTASLNGRELARLGIEPGDGVRVQSRRGEVLCAARRDDGTPDGTVFMPFAFAEAAANLLTNPALDPFGKIPEFKYCAARIGPAPAPAIAAE